MSAMRSYVLKLCGSKAVRCCAMALWGPLGRRSLRRRAAIISGNVEKSRVESHNCNRIAFQAWTTATVSSCRVISLKRTAPEYVCSVAKILVDCNISQSRSHWELSLSDIDPHMACSSCKATTKGRSPKNSLTNYVDTVLVVSFIRVMQKR